MRLSEFPTGQTIFLDANCLIYHFAGTYPSCALLLDRAHRGDVHLVTSAVTLGEVHHRLMVLETAKRLSYPLRNASSFLKRHPELIRSLSDCERALDCLPAFRLRVVSVTRRLLDEARRVGHELGLLTNDALIVATMRAYGLHDLASNDRDFRAVPGLRLWTP